MRPSSPPNSWRCHRWGPWPVRQEWVRTCYRRYWRGLAAKCLWKKSHISHHEIIYDKLQYCIWVWTDWQWDQEIKQEEGWGPHVLRSQFSWAIHASAIFSIHRHLYMHDWSGVNLLDPWHPMAMFLNIPQTRETKIALRSRSCPFGQWLYLASTKNEGLDFTARHANVLRQSRKDFCVHWRLLNGIGLWTFAFWRLFTNVLESFPTKPNRPKQTVFFKTEDGTIVAWRFLT